MVKEQAYLYARQGKEDEAIAVLVDGTQNFTEAIEMVLKLNFSKIDVFWDKLVAKAANDTAKVNDLMQYLLHINNQKSVIRQFSRDTQFHQVKQQLISAFLKLKMHKQILQKSIKMAKVEENYELTHYQDLCSAGISDIRNVCDDCGKKLLDETGIAESWLSKDKKG